MRKVYLVALGTFGMMMTGSVAQAAVTVTMPKLPSITIPVLPTIAAPRNVMPSLPKLPSFVIPRIQSLPRR